MNGTVYASSLTKRFGRTQALDGLDLTVPEGSVYALVGPNGAGKTTTIKILMNLLRATSGDASVLGRDSRALEPADYARIGYVSENQALPLWMPVGYFMEYLRPFYSTWDRALADRLLRQLELPLDRKLRHLSRGMRMKAALAASLAYHPRLIVLDEPFSGLDALVRDELIESLLDAAAESTVFISSHDLAEIESFCSHVGFLHRGRLQSSEELPALTARFREIEVTCPATVAPPEPWPEHWLNRACSGPVARFTDSHFDAATSPRRIHALFGQDCRIDVKPLSLRAIFVALTKSNREAAL